MIANTNDDVDWRLKTLYSIYRRIISFKRQQDIAVQIQCVGLIAYAKAFKRIWEEQRSAAKDEIPTYYDDAMKESIQASELRMRYKSQQSSDRWAMFRTVSIALFGLIFSFSNLIKIPTPPPVIKAVPSPALIWTAAHVLTSPFEILGVVTALLLFSIFSRSTYFKPDEWRFFRYFQALVQPYSRFSAFTVFLAIALLIAWLGLKTIIGWHTPTIGFFVSSFGHS